MKDTTYSVSERLWVTGSMVSAVPVFPPMAYPGGRAALPVPSSTTVLQNCLISSEVDSETTCFRMRGSMFSTVAPLALVILFTI